MPWLDGPLWRLAGFRWPWRSFPYLPLAICIYGAVLTLRTIPITEIAISVPRREFKPLWAFVAGVAESVGSRAPYNIIIGMTGNFYVTQVPIVLFDGTRLNRRTLYLSGPLLHLMDVEEVKAVLGHEFSHFTGNDTLYSSQVAPAYRSMREGMASMKASMEGNIFVAVGVSCAPGRACGLPRRIQDD